MDSPSVFDDAVSLSERPIGSALSGCFYAFFVVALSVLLLLMNSSLCYAMYTAIYGDDKDEMTARLGQLFFFIAPLVLLIIEWNLLDRLQRLFRIRP